MGESELLHRLYTNAAAGGPFETTGARPLPLAERDVSGAVSPDVLAGLDDLLKKAQPAGNETAWVARRLAASDGGSYACVVASYPDLIPDAGGRRGFLNHARLVRVTEPAFAAPALFEAASGFPIEEICAAPEEQRLGVYLDLVRGEGGVVVRPVAISVLQQIPRAVLEDALAACLAGVGKRQQTRFALPEVDLEQLALIWSAIPFALQRVSSWAAGADDGCPVDAIFSAKGKAPARVAQAVLVDCVKRYVRLLHDAPADFDAILRNPNVSTLVELDEVVKRATAGAPVRAQSAGRSAQESEMQTKKPRASRDDSESLEPDTVAEMKRQYDAMTLSVRDYVDKRTAALETRGPSPPPSIATLWIPAVAILSLLLSGFALFLSLRKPAVTASPDTGRPERVEDPAPVYTEPEAQPPQKSRAANAVAEAAVTGKWADALRDLLAADAGFAADAISSLRAPALDPFAARVAAKRDLKPEGRDQLRALLIDAIAAERDPGEKVDGKLAAASLNQLRREFRVESTKSQDVQSEIILRWMVSIGR